MIEEIAHPNYGLSRSLEEPEQDQLLPRAVSRTTDFQLLDGNWNFEIDTRENGIHENWHLGHHYVNTALWPGSIEDHMNEAVTDDGVKKWHDKVVAWYEREFTLDENPNDTPTSMWQLTFGACGYKTEVWLNGIQISTIEGEYTHVGEYTSFSYELNNELLRPINRITVRITDTMDADIPRGKQESHVYKRGGIWYQTHTGAVRSIWLERVERNRLRSRVGVVSIVEDQLVRFNLTTRIHDPGKYTISLLVYERKEKDPEPLATADFVLLLDAGQKQQRVVMELPGSKLWSPEDPVLYRLVARLKDEFGRESEIETRFGLRKIEARGSTIYLNNQPTYLDGILYQPGISTYEEIGKHMHAMKDLGCNLVRIHIAGVDPRIYNLADKIGILLWVEVPSPHHSSHTSRVNHKEELIRMLALIETHPSVVIWSLYNEDWGIQDVATNAETRNYIIDMYHYMHINHPQFLVVDNDGWQHVSLEGRLKSDLLTAHLYTPDIEHWKKLLKQLVDGQLNGVAAFPLVVGDPFFFRKQVPLVVSEWGGFGFANYGGPQDAKEQAEQIRIYKDELRKLPIAGDVYTQATNIEDERNGLIDENTAQLRVPSRLLRSIPPKPPK
ncbi:MAG TPA: glycoside hydrolase family 2 TIM barrel-domain containing protein [Flavitalea sp.]|nr:glycoside hydrolase family 2 TIM barrel-domain containing protein [Flavitalea sp.]